MKLNMMVVMTMWLPRLACSHAGISAQAPPNTAAATVAISITSDQCQPVSKDRATRATPRPAK